MRQCELTACKTGRQRIVTSRSDHARPPPIDADFLFRWGGSLALDESKTGDGFNMGVASVMGDCAGVYDILYFN